MDDHSTTSSPLSLQSSDNFEADEERMAEAAMPPAKRQRIGESSRGSVLYEEFEDGLISSDSEGDIPTSPGAARQEDDDTHEQVTECQWIGCDAGDLGNMDNLVEHIHNEHVESRSKKYTCEWSDCTRRSANHASAYALKAHMRSHTKEKPFYCELPECDRSFTRSDALQKHYRTVHETEALRPSDPIPKAMQAKQSVNSARLKEYHPHYSEALPQPASEPISAHDTSAWALSNPTDVAFEPAEEALGWKALYRLLRRQILWAEEESERLKRSCESLEELRKREWTEKEIFLHQALDIEADWHKRRSLVLSGGVNIAAPVGLSQGEAVQSTSPYPAKPVDDREAAAVLASMAAV